MWLHVIPRDHHFSDLFVADAANMVAAALLLEAMLHLRSHGGIERYRIEVHRLEKGGDQVARAAIADLFSAGSDPVEVIKWKETYGLLEA